MRRRYEVSCDVCKMHLCTFWSFVRSSDNLYLEEIDAVCQECKTDQDIKDSEEENE